MTLQPLLVYLKQTSVYHLTRWHGNRSVRQHKQPAVLRLSSILGIRVANKCHQADG